MDISLLGGSSVSNIVTVLGNSVGLSGPISVAIATGLFVGWICWRSKSSHLILIRLWRLAYGRQGIKDRELLKFIRTRDRLIFLRMHGVPARTLCAGKKLLAWAEKHDEEMADINACGPLFDREACALRVAAIPATWWRFLASIGCMALAMGLMFSGALTATDRAILQFKDSGTWFSLAPDRAAPLRHQGTVTTQACVLPAGQTPPANDVFSTREVADLCILLRSPTRNIYIEDIVRAQRWSSGFLTLILLFMALNLFIFLRRAQFASKMQDRMAIRSAGQAASDSGTSS